jgi:hypothetical protein
VKNHDRKYLAITALVACYLGTILACLALAVVVWPGWIASIVFLVFAACLMTLLPGRQSLSRDAKSVDRGQHPSLVRAVDMVCKATGARRPDFVVLTILPVVSPVRSGFGIWPRTGVAIGYPIWDAATPAVQGALIAQAVVVASSTASVGQRFLTLGAHIFRARNSPYLTGGVPSDAQSVMEYFPDTNGDDSLDMEIAPTSIMSVIGIVFAPIMLVPRLLTRWTEQARSSTAITITEHADAAATRFAGFEAHSESLRLGVLAPSYWRWATRGLSRHQRNWLTAVPLDDILEGMSEPEDGLYEVLLEQEEKRGRVSGNAPQLLTRARVDSLDSTTPPSALLAQLLPVLVTASAEIAAIRKDLNSHVHH